MSANESIGHVPELTESQKDRFKRICKRVSDREISANKSYEYAQMDGENPDDKGFNGTFKDWIATASNHDWFGEKRDLQQNQIKQPDPPKKKGNPIIPILISISAAIILYVVVKKIVSNKDK